MATGDPTGLHPYFRDSTAISFLKQQDSIVLFLKNFDDDKYGPGWAWEDYPYYFSPEKSALPLYGNVVTILGGEQLKIIPSHFSKDVKHNTNMPVREWKRNRFYISQESKDTIQVPYITSDSLTLVLLGNETKKNIALLDTVPKVDWTILPGIPVDSILKQMMGESDNFLAEQLMLMASSTLSDTLSFESARDFVLKNKLNDLKHPPRWVDGSGLSRYNLFTPNSMVDVLTKLYKEIDSTRLFVLMPKWNANGTITIEDPARKKAFIHAKSGSMGNVYNLSGYVTTKSGKLLLFSFMNNHFRRPSKQVRQDMYDIFKLIHEEY